MARLDDLPARELPGGYRVAEARTRPARAKGLAGLDEIPENHALWIPKCRSVHTFHMRFALDLVWLDADGKPVRIDRDVAPRRMRMCLGARSVVETRAGRADEFLAAGL